MLSNSPCSCEDTSRCSGFFTEAEIMMAKLKPGMTVQQYHEVMDLFDRAFDITHENW